MTFEIITTIVVLGIFCVFYIYAQKAEKVVAAQAKAKLAQQQNTLAAAVPPKKAAKKGNQSKNKVIV